VSSRTATVIRFNPRPYLTVNVRSFGMLPVGVRDYVGGAIAVQADGPSAGSSGDFIGMCPFVLPVAVSN